MATRAQGKLESQLAWQLCLRMLTRLGLESPGRGRSAFSVSLTLVPQRRSMPIVDVACHAWLSWPSWLRSRPWGRWRSGVCSKPAGPDGLLWGGAGRGRVWHGARCARSDRRVHDAVHHGRFGGRVTGDLPYTVLNTPAALIAMELGLRGPNVTVNHRDLSAAEAIASACDLLRCGRVDAVLAGGADELSQSLVHAYRSLSVLACDSTGQAADAARGETPCPGPYDRRRRGLCPGEGRRCSCWNEQKMPQRRGRESGGRSQATDALATLARAWAGGGRGRSGHRSARAVQAVRGALDMAELSPAAISGSAAAAMAPSWSR